MGWKSMEWSTHLAIITPLVPDRSGPTFPAGLVRTSRAGLVHIASSSRPSHWAPRSRLQDRCRTFALPWAPPSGTRRRTTAFITTAWTSRVRCPQGLVPATSPCGATGAPPLRSSSASVASRRRPMMRTITTCLLNQWHQETTGLAPWRPRFHQHRRWRWLRWRRRPCAPRRLRVPWFQPWHPAPKGNHSQHAWCHGDRSRSIHSHRINFYN